MLFVIPTYKRIDRLKWTLLSILQAECARSSRVLRLCIVNNHPPSAENLNRLMQDIKTQYPEHKAIEWLVVHRKRTLDPVANWYSAIEEMAEPDETVFLHGDDDLLMPWGVEERARAAIETEADMLLSRSMHGLVFLPDQQHCLMRKASWVFERSGEVGTISWGEIDAWGPAFIGNHCYRNTKNFRDALALAFSWCHEQDWLDWNTRTLMLPYYLPFAIRKVGGRLYGVRTTCVLRGSGLEERLHARFGVPGWNPGFLTWCAYGVLSNADLGPITELSSARASLVRMAADWFLTFYLDTRVPSAIRRETLRRLGTPLNAWSLISILSGLRRIVGECFGLRGLSTRIQSIRQSQPVASVLMTMRQFS
ncbi:MAG: hypothetical protein DDT19_02724 [Syntrophomonadaceae bacterium]|nr:hypothetical protein [Bacillota bacterium]